MSQNQSTRPDPPNNEYRDASFAHPADPSNTSIPEDSNSVNENYQRTYPVNNQNSFRPSPFNKRNAGGPSFRNSAGRNDTSEMPLSQTNIYVRGLPPDFSNDDLKDLCSKFGRIVLTKAVVEPESNKCRGYGFIDFENPQSANRALTTINSDGVFEAEMAKEIRGKSIDRHLEQDPTNLYIANLPRDFTESSIREMLSAHGMVISTRVLRNPDGSSRCVGFARMETKQCCDQIIAYYNGKKLDPEGDALVVKLADSGARRPKHSTSSSGTISSEQANVFSNWHSVQAGRYSYPAQGYNDQFSFSPILPNGGFQMYDAYGQNLTNVTNVPAMPVGVQYPIIYQSPTRQVASNVQPPAPTTPNQVMYQQQVPIQQQSNEYYGKNVYKQPPQNYNAAYYPTYVPYASDYVVNPQQYIQSPVSYSTANIVSGQDYIYANGAGTPIYVTGQFYPSPSQIPFQMTDSVGNPKQDMYAGESSYSNDPSESANDQLQMPRPASVEVDIGSSSGQFQQANVRPYVSDTKLNDS